MAANASDKTLFLALKANTSSVDAGGEDVGETAGFVMALRLLAGTFSAMPMLMFGSFVRRVVLNPWD